MTQRLCMVALVVSLACGCGEPDMINLGTFESPCETNQDCASGLCLQLDGQGSCTSACTFTCVYAYQCADGICVPDLGPDIRRSENQRCGPSLPPCRDDLICIDWPEWGSRCTQRCMPEWDPWRCWSGCCATTGAVSVCAPPTYCR